MKVFIHWSGERSKQLGEAIREWLPNVLQFVKPYFSPADIDKGARWANEISKELEQSKIGIIAMTDENRTNPWIMFETGAISKVVEEGVPISSPAPADAYDYNRDQSWKAWVNADGSIRSTPRTRWDF